MWHNYVLMTTTWGNMLLNYVQDYDDCNLFDEEPSEQTQWAPSNHHPSHVVKESPTLQYRVYRPESLIKAN